MSAEFIKEIENIYRLKVPFFSAYTSVFLVESEGEYAIVDCATTQEDVEGWIVPALQKQGVPLEKIRYIVVSHHHEDHAGGLEWLLPYCKNAEVVTSVKGLFPNVETYPMPGHTLDCIGVLDLRSGTLISVDGIQGYGIGKYRCSTHDENAYLTTLANVGKDARIENILFAHAYEPWYQNHAFGKEEIKKCLQDSEDYIAKRRV